MLDRVSRGREWLGIDALTLIVIKTPSLQEIQHNEKSKLGESSIHKIVR